MSSAGMLVRQERRRSSTDGKQSLYLTRRMRRMLSLSKTSNIFSSASALVPLGLESFDEGDTKNLRVDVYQANVPKISAYSLVSFLEYRKKYGLTPVFFRQPHITRLW